MAFAWFEKPNGKSEVLLGNYVIEVNQADLLIKPPKNTFHSWNELGALVRPKWMRRNSKNPL